MKNLIKLLLVLMVIFLKVNLSIAVIPSYKLIANEFTMISPNTLEFEIRLIHTNPDSSIFLYSLGQYLFDFNPEFSNGGTLTLIKLDSELPEGLQPYNLSVNGSQLQLPGGFFTSNYPNISSSFPGTLIVKVRLQTSAASFTGSLDLNWRNGPENLYTRIRAYINNWNTEITNPLNHFIDFPTGTQSNMSNIPGKYSLYQNYPNPFNPVTKIKFDLPSDIRIQLSEVKLVVYNNQGKEIVTLFNGKQDPGSYAVDFNGEGLPSGVYFYKLEAGEYVETKRMMLLK
ncbi:MAG: T9SS type A sorting domain-containing protein [Ignavibacteria bacterium]|nr:T9SS type A sorting domain-containing protein [Ignavibacteria bacterium]